MSQSRGIAARIREFFSTPLAAARPRWKAVNLTRQTVLAGNLEMADTGPTRNKGLLGRTGLAAGEGLWIIPCEAVHTFGMKFAIDLVYLDRKHRVRKVRSDVPARRLSACMTAHSILELPAGTIQQTLTRAGDTLELSPVEALSNSS
jgi:uncharacterized membrane protein (UPF0127 family)